MDEGKKQANLIEMSYEGQSDKYLYEHKEKVLPAAEHRTEEHRQKLIDDITNTLLNVSGGAGEAAHYVVDSLDEYIAKARQEERNRILDIFEKQGPGAMQRLIIQLREES